MARALYTDNLTPNVNEVLSYKQFTFAGHRVSLEPVSDREFKEKAEYEKFMQDLLEIELAETSDARAYELVPVGVNGEQAWLPRGRRLSVPRYLVEVLLRSQETTFKTEYVKDPSATEGAVQRKRNSQNVAVLIHKDPSPKGRAWTERVMREGT